MQQIFTKWCVTFGSELKTENFSNMPVQDPKSREGGWCIVDVTVTYAAVAIDKKFQHKTKHLCGICN